ncbi:MAG: DUF58 domain-containing protein, partial [Halobacteriales archaeon]
MRPTRRGYAVALIIAGATVAASMHGPRGLDAIIVPVVVGFAVGAVQLWWIDAPEVERRIPGRGSRKDRVTVALEVEVENAVSGRFQDTVPPELEASGNERLVTLDDTVFEYDVTLSERGEHAVGPLSITVTDVLGLVSVTYSYPKTDEILVRPQVLPISVPPSDIYPDYGDLGPERGEFDHLREYHPGDPTQDIHWKSSAKRVEEGFLVSEFSASEEGIDAITVAVDAVPGRADDTADAAASLLVFLLSAGLETGLRTPSAEFDPATGPDHRDDLLDALARFEPGTLRDGQVAEAKLHVSGDNRGVLVETGGRTLRFENLLG